MLMFAKRDREAAFATITLDGLSGQTRRVRLMEKVLIANRGEIAVRIAKTLRGMDMKSVGIAHEYEGETPATRCVDELIVLRGDSPIAAYLDAKQILEGARERDVDAIHPGYGFLSENPKFAHSTREFGMTYIGPSPEVIELMGDKILAREFVSKEGFRIAPSEEEGEDPLSFKERSEAIGFPLVLKAAAGGGGKGMHIVRSAKDLVGAIDLAKGEAERYFDDGRIYAERYIENPRHIEVQVMADKAGNCLHFFERECSIQRRFQKIIEESPSLALDKKLRRKICSEAVGIAIAAKYENAGTIEFILAPDGEFYFLEMNTRLQVEHPVTEMITGRDLVELQIRIARGEELSIGQEEIKTKGHAIECRVYAEDVEHDFSPCIGRLVDVHEPVAEFVRFDSGVAKGSEVSADFDPMLAKLIVYGETREEAISRSVESLKQTSFLGVNTNLAYLSRIVAHPAFVKGETDTGFVARHKLDLAPKELSTKKRRMLLAAAALSNRDFRERVEAVPEPYASIGDWSN